MKKIVFAALLASAFSAQAATELVVNGDFETGTFAGWTRSGNLSLNDVIKNTVTSNRTWVWRNGATGSVGYISQVLNTIAGQRYTLSFDVYNTATSTDPNKVTFNAMFGDNEVYSVKNTALNWSHITLDVLATSNATELKFGARNDPSFFRMDNVSVQAAVPEAETYAMLLAGLGVMGMIARRRKAA
ncbi:PEP-CTERM sorting domain-containing protein [Massilia sp. W12]|uniref:PEP-CTERM sorting domain-containing protein n=1 Tax=Massilia sp. W12 TaxID=3126507 RepID=UPI0030D3E22A